MKFVPASLSSKIGRQLLHVQKASPALLFGAGVVGVVGATVLACRATLQLEETIDDTQKYLRIAEETAKDETEVKREKAFVYLRAVGNISKLYGPSIVLGAVSVGCLTSSHNILNRRNAALTAAYAAVNEAFDEYRDRVTAEVGSEKEEDIYRNLESCEIADEKGKKTSAKRVGQGKHSPYARFFDHNSSSWDPYPEHNVVFLRCQQNYLNDKLKARGHVFLNEAYDALGIERSQPGAVVGWVWRGDGDDYIDFGIFNQEMTPQAFEFFTGSEGAILLDFNVDGVIFDKI